MVDKCDNLHTMLSDGKLVPNPQGGSTFVPGDFPDLVFGHGDTKDKAEADAIKNAKEAAAKFCAKKAGCREGGECVWSNIERKFDAVIEYATKGMGCVAVLRINVIECK
jgi:hypothetical protein